MDRLSASEIARPESVTPGDFSRLPNSIAGFGLSLDPASVSPPSRTSTYTDFGTGDAMSIAPLFL